MPDGTVTAAFGRQFYVRGDDGAELICVMRGKRNDAAVGDRVRLAATGAGGGVIEQVLARRSVLVRSDRRRTRVFAANLTRIAVVIAPDPPASEELLMRALVAAHEAGLSAAIVLNKADLLADESIAIRSTADEPAVDRSTARAPDGEPAATPSLARRAPLYEALGVPVLRVAARTDPAGTRATLLPWLRDEATLLLGQSGMGKSTLINLLVPGAAMATRTISQALGTGRHTTTFARSFVLPEGGVIIDSPGFQEFGLEHLSLSQVQAALPDFADCLGRCRFNNCTHRTEPGCAVREAVSAGRIDARRHALYVELADALMRPLH